MITAVILAKDAQETIGRTIKAVQFCGEILMIDDYSTDETVKIARELGARVHERELKGDFAAQRNFGMEKAGHKAAPGKAGYRSVPGDPIWILFVDADEVVSNQLKDEISKRVQDDDGGVSAFYLKRRDFWLGKELRFGEVKKARQRGFMRLVKMGSGKWVGAVHETFATAGKTSTLEHPLYHYPHPTVADFLREVNLYSTWRADELYRQNKKTNVFEIVLYPFAKFILNYVIHMGFRDGAHGFIYAFMMSFHSFLVRAKLYLKRVT